MGNIQMEQQMEIRQILIYKGKVAAIRKLMEYTHCRVREATQLIEKMAEEIEPGPADNS